MRSLIPALSRKIAGKRHQIWLNPGFFGIISFYLGFLLPLHSGIRSRTFPWDSPTLQPPNPSPFLELSPAQPRISGWGQIQREATANPKPRAGRERRELGKFGIRRRKTRDFTPTAARGRRRRRRRGLGISNSPQIRFFLQIPDPESARCRKIKRDLSLKSRSLHF